MKMPAIAAALICTCLLTVGRAADRITGPWDVPALTKDAPKAEWGERKGLVQPVYYEGVPFQGKPTRVFAYYGRPAEGDGPFPAMLLVHGGGGKAFAKWAEHWAARGYVALAMDLAGNGPEGRLPDGGPNQDDDTKFRDFSNADVKDMWTYHAVAAVLRGHSLLASRPEVDRQRIGVTGISWGGYLTCIVAGIDERLKVAVPVYGCGFLHENSAWREGRFDKMTAEQRERWVSHFDPSKYLPGVSCPILFVNGTNDFAYPLDSYQKSYSLVTSPRTLSIRVGLPHGHIWTFQEVDAFVDSVLKEGKPLASISLTDTSHPRARATVTSELPLTKAELHYTTDVGRWQDRKWTTVAAELIDGTIYARLPDERPFVGYLSATDERGLLVNSPHFERPVADLVWYEWVKVTTEAPFAPRNGAVPSPSPARCGSSAAGTRARQHASSSPRSATTKSGVRPTEQPGPGEAEHLRRSVVRCGQGLGRPAHGRLRRLSGQNVDHRRRLQPGALSERRLELGRRQDLDARVTRSALGAASLALHGRPRRQDLGDRRPDDAGLRQSG